MKEKSQRVMREESVLSALLLGEFKLVASIGLEPEDFTGIRRSIFAAGRDLARQNGAADVVSISGRVGDASYVSSLLTIEATSANLKLYVRELKDVLYAEAIARAKEKAAARLSSGEDVAEVARACIAEMDCAADRFRDSAANELLEATSVVMDKIASGAKSEALQLGIPPLDRLTGGLVGGESVILAGRPSSGKTALALQIMRVLSINGIKSQFFSLEMTPTMVAGRLLAQIAGIDSRDLVRSPDRAPRAKREYALAYREAMQDIASRISCHFNSAARMSAIRPLARRAVNDGAKLLCLDYIQLMEGDSSMNRNLQLEQISRQWRGLLKELNVPGIILSQLSRGCEQENRYPNLSDLRDSGSIEQDADIVWLLSHPVGKNHGLPNDCVVLIQAKGRDHGTGVAKLKFDRPTQTFYEYTGEEQ